MPLAPALLDLNRRMHGIDGLGRISGAEIDAAEARRRAQVRVEVAGREQAAVVAVEELAVEVGGRPVRLKLFRPEHAEHPEPPVLYLHSGGWVTNSPMATDATCRRLAVSLGLPVLGLDYSLAPEHPYPRASDETVAVLEWLRDHGEEHNLDGSRTVLVGESAGGSVAAGALLRLRDGSGLDSVAAAVLIVPVLDHDFTRASYQRYDKGEIDGRSGLHWFARQYVPDFDAHAEDPYCWPLRAEDLSSLPPLVVVTAEYDPLRDEQFEFVKRVADAGGRVSHLYFPSVTHGFFGLEHIEPVAREAQADVAHAVGQYLASGATAVDEQRPRVVTSVENRVATIEISNPRKRNAITHTMWSDLICALDDAEQDPDVGAVLLRGAGEDFSAGLDIAELLPGYQGESDAIADVNRMLDHAVRAGTRLSTLTKPVVAEVSGACVGAGFLLFLACDLAVVTDDAKFRLPATAIGAGLFGPTLASLVGPRRAKALLLAPGGLRLNGEDVFELGLASAVVRADELRACAAEFASSVAAQPAGWLQIQKASVDQVAGGVSIPDALRIGAYFDAVAHASGFAKIGAQALAERFKGA